MIFTIKNNIPTISMVGVNIPEFRAVWIADKSRMKNKAKGELAYIYHMVSANSPYFSLPDGEKEDTIKEAFIPADIRNRWKPSEKVKEAIKAFEQMPPNNSPSIRMLQAAYSVLDKLRDYFNNVNFEERDMDNRLLHDPKRTMDTLKGISGLVHEIRELELAVKKDIAKDDIHITGGATFSVLEDEI